jgi:uncharacterized protein
MDAIHISTDTPVAAPDAESAEKVRALRLAATYDEPTQAVDLIETHFAWVFLTDDCVYKLKKPIRAPGLDLLDLDKRHHNCLEELRLNRRLAPDVYLGLVPLTRESDGPLRLG